MIPTGLRKLIKRLKDLGIEAIGPKTVDSTETARHKELMQKVLKRAEMIRTRWKNIPELPRATEVKEEEVEEEGPDAEGGTEPDSEAKEAA